MRETGEKSCRTVKPADLFLLAGVLLAAILIFMLVSIRGDRAGSATVRISCDGQVLAEVPLSDNRICTFYREEASSETGGARLVFEAIPEDREGIRERNLIVIADGVCRVTQADCPDGICVLHGGIRRPGEAIICLPHHLVVEITGGENGQIDAVTW